MPELKVTKAVSGQSYKSPLRLLRGGEGRLQRLPLSHIRTRRNQELRQVLQ